MTRVGLVVVLVLAACGDDDGGSPPSILSRTPDEGADNVYVGDPIEVVFSEAIAPGTEVILSDDGGRAIEHQDSWSADQTTLTSIITGRPAAPTAVTIVISGAADTGRHVMPDATWSWQLPMWQQPGGPLNVDPATTAGGERLAVDSQRRMVVAWWEGAGQIRVKRLAGSTWETLGDALGGAGARTPVVAIDAADRPVVAWVEGGTTTTAQAARWDGSAWTALPSPGPAVGMAIAADSAGAIYVAVEGAAADVVVSRLTAADAWESLGGPTSSGTPVTPDSSASIALAISGDGPIVAWAVATSTITSEIRTARLAANGATSWENLNILNRSMPSTARYPELTVDPSGRAVVAWEEYDGVSIDASVATLTSARTYWQLLGRTLDVDLLDHARWPGVAMGPDGTIFVAWSEFHGAVQRIWVARSQAGGDWEFVGGQAVNREPGSVNALPKLAVLDRWPVVVWQEGEGFDWTAAKVWVRRYNGNEVRLPGLTARPTTAGCSFDASSTLLLSQTGCFSVGPDPIPDPGLIPFDINAHLWSDGALKRRWMVVPDGQTVQPTDVDGWTMPVGTMIIKEFALQMDENDPRSRRPIETRFLVKRDAENNWEGFSFQWSDDFSDAALLPTDATTKDWTITSISGSQVVHTHTYPGRDQCLTCHAQAANVVLGISSRQLSRFYDYDGVADQQLEAMDRIGLFASPLQGLPANPVTRPSDVTQIRESRARAYLAANCAHCHRPGGARPTRDMRWETPLASTLLCADNEIVPGFPGGSLLYQRMSARPGMPPLATLVTDAFALDLMSRWISGMTSCP